MNAALVFCIYWIYSLCVFLVKRRLYPRQTNGGLKPREPWLPGQEISLIVSPDYWWARRFKYQIQVTAPFRLRAGLLKCYVVSNNRINLAISLMLAIGCLTVKTFWPDSLFFQVVTTVALVRFFSRSYEITFAFGSDVLQTANSSTGLRKEERVRLAMLSYLEIYFYAAAAYTALPAVSNAGQALTLALNVGTLTNVGFVYSLSPASFWLNIVFVQVLATLSLVVLSLAAYLGRKR